MSNETPSNRIPEQESGEPEGLPEHVEIAKRDYGWELCNSPEDIEGVMAHWRPKDSTMSIMKFRQARPETGEPLYVRIVQEPGDEAIDDAKQAIIEDCDRETLLKAVSGGEREGLFWKTVEDWERQDDGWISRIE